jgi:multidrug efflux pump subunit AcrA (membrane-fusion protein)
MESSQLAQRMLMLMSFLVLGVTGAAWWWVANEPASNSAALPIGAPASELASSPDASPRISAQVDEAAVTSPSINAMRLAAFDQETGESPYASPQRPAAQTPQGFQVPVTGVPVTGVPVTGVPVTGVPVPAAVGLPSPGDLPLASGLPSASGLQGTSSGAISFKGVLAFVHDVKVVAQADGVIREFLVDEGSVVEKDKIMLEIDNRLARAEQEIARRELESAQLKAEDESQIKFAIASEEVARSDYTRTEDLYKREVANIDEYERKRLEWIKSKFSIDVSRREQKINQAAVGVSEAKLNASAVQVELRTIRAPFTGIVAKTEKENFEWVKAGDEILRLVSLETFRVRGRVQIDDSPNILERAPAKVYVQVQPGQVEAVNGVVGFVEPETSVAVDGKNEYGVWVEIENRVVNGQFLFRGKMNATVEIYPNR